MTRYRLTAMIAALLVGAGAVEAQKEGRGRQDGQRAKPQASQQQRAKPQERGQAQGGQRAKPQAAQQQRAKPQERGQGQGQSAPRQQGKAADRSQGQAERARPQDARSQNAARSNRVGAPRAPGSLRRVSRPVRLDRLPARFRPLESSNPGHRVAGIALARGLDHNNALPVDFVVDGDRIRLTNRRDELLLDLSDDEARRLGAWDVRRLDPRGVREDAPAFCRSGAGHPVWGREWCMDKGFGLGSSNDWLWGRHRPDDILFLRDDRLSLDRGGLLDVLGSVVFNRLALHALTLGLVDPLAGQWIGEPAGPRVMLLDSGDTQVAELVDLDRDGRVDVMYVVSR